MTFCKCHFLEVYNMKTCIFFGHRDCPDTIRPKLKNTIELLISENGFNVFLVGNHGNFDRIVREVLKELETTYNIHYEIILNTLPNPKKLDYTEYDTAHYTLPENLELTPPKYSIDFRNKYMINRAQYVISYITHNFGTGAAKYVQLAKKKDIPVINLADK